MITPRIEVATRPAHPAGQRIVDDIALRQRLELFDEQRESLEDVLIATLDIEETLAQNAINAALGAISQTVNTALGFALLA